MNQTIKVNWKKPGQQEEERIIEKETILTLLKTTACSMDHLKNAVFYEIILAIEWSDEIFINFEESNPYMSCLVNGKMKQVYNIGKNIVAHALLLAYFS